LRKNGERLAARRSKHRQRDDGDTRFDDGGDREKVLVTVGTWTPARLPDLIPDAKLLLELEPEELGLMILRILNAQPRNHHHGGNFVGGLAPATRSGYPDEHAEAIQHAVLEGWAWLLGEGLLAPVPHGFGSSSGWVFVTRRGQRIVSEETAADYTKASFLPWKLIHPQIAKACRAAFLRGDYQTAVFKAFKEVEVEVRAAGGYTHADYGHTLMRAAFHPETGRHHRCRARSIGAARPLRPSSGSYRVLQEPAQPSNCGPRRSN
jgi:Protein of unknown function (Hypoth_ymh)